MLISLNWIRDFVDLPRDLDPEQVAEQFTVTTAEVEGIEHVRCEAAGLVVAEVRSVEAIPETPNLYAIRASIGQTVFDSVTQAKDLSAGDKVIFAPPEATLPGVGKVTEIQTAGRRSVGMVVPGDALGMHSVGQNAVWLPPTTKSGSPVDMSHFDDWIIEVDNKSITHRPDLWGHYGIAREFAAIYRKPLAAYKVVPVEELQSPELPEIPIVIDRPDLSPRYSALRFTGVRPQPAPLWMQARLALLGLRPIDILVDLTNYIMLELSQPMHAFDAKGIERIEVALAEPGEKFTTLDGVQRTMPDGALMIQSNRQSVALAGIMGGADTEISESTTDLLLESANFEPAVIRKCAAALGHRTDASARFEKSLDPHNTVLGIQRFVELARPELPGMKLTSRLSDAFPRPPQPTHVAVDPAFVGTYMGRSVSTKEITGILDPLGFTVREEAGRLDVQIPSWRATKDIAIEADIIEEIARFIGYDSIDPVLPTVTVRYIEPNPVEQLERDTLRLFCGGLPYAELHRTIWFDGDLLRILKWDPGRTINLRNPAAAGNERLRTTLIPGLLAAIERNRHHQDSFDLIEIGSAFFPDGDSPREQRHLAMAVVAPGRKAAHEDAALKRLKTDLETWAFKILGSHVRFRETKANPPWEHPEKSASVVIEDQEVGRITVVPGACKRALDEHLAAWSIALAELDIARFADHRLEAKKLVPIPTYPSIEVDFSVLTEADRRYADIEKALAAYDHPLLCRLALVDSYEGGSVPTGKRSFMFRATIRDPGRTLTEEDIQDFRRSFISMLEQNALQLRT